MANEDEKTYEQDAGKPVTSESIMDALGALPEPSAEELDKRQQMKAKPRRQAGPEPAEEPQAALESLSQEPTPEETEPKEP